MSFFINLSIGIAIGAGAILPGISSGVLCVIFGIYEKLLDSILGFFKNFNKNFKFLLPIILGTIIGIFLFGNILNYLLYRFPIQIKSTFIGLILGTMPFLIKDVNNKINFNSSYIYYSLFAFCLGLLMVFLEHTININELTNINTYYLVLSGFLMSVGVIVPGVSSTIILMLLGIYSTYLHSISFLYFPVLIPMGIGLVFGCFVWMCITKFLLNKFYGITFYSIIGFSFGSIVVLFPNISSIIELFISIFCILLGFYISNLRTKEV